MKLTINNKIRSVFVGEKRSKSIMNLKFKVKDMLISFKLDLKKLKQHGIGPCKVETLQKMIPERFIANCLQFNIDPIDWLKAATKYPQLLSMLPETINTNIESAAKLLGLNKDVYLRAALRQPSLFCFSPETIYKNIEKASIFLGINQKLFIRAALNTPSLFYQSPETIKNNIGGSAELLGLSNEQYINMCILKSSLFTMQPQTVWGNFMTLSLLFDNRKEAIDRVKYAPTYLTSSQEHNIIHLIARKITGNKTNLLNNPRTYLEEYFAARPEAWNMMQRILNRFEELNSKWKKEFKPPI